MKIFYRTIFIACKQARYIWLIAILTSSFAASAQTATVSNPLAIGQNCGGGGSNFKSFVYDSVAKVLKQVGANCSPSLASPGFNPGGGSIAFSPKDQKLYYIETTTGNNSIVWGWTPGVCPTGSQAAIYTYSNTFIVGLEFNTITGDGYQLEFSTGSAPYNIYLRKVTSFGPPLVAGPAVQIVLPSGVTINQQNGDIVITPTGKMYFVLDNKMFSLDYSTYSSGILNANFIGPINTGTGNNIIGLCYVNGNFIASVQGSGCSYKQIDISSGSAVLQPVTLFTGTFVSYDMATMITGIGAAKRVTSLSSTGAGTYRVDYDIKVKNYGNVDLNAVQLIDSVAKVFGITFINASVAAVGVLPGGLTLNPTFDGLTDARIFAAGSTMKASPADSAVVRLTVNLNNPNKAATYLNSAIATATGAIFGNLVRDSSDNQMTLNPDVSGTDVPDSKGESVPTPLSPSTWLLLPEQITGLTARKQGTTIELRWNLQNQEDGTQLLIQRSSDGMVFENVGKLFTFNQPGQAYQWVDRGPGTGDNYYRLALSSSNRSIPSYSETVVIRKLPDLVTIMVSPNPFVNSLQAKITMERPEMIHYRLLDFVSAVIQQGNMTGHTGVNTINIDVTGVRSSGAYILETIVGNRHYYHKIIRE
jgi:uncharacterized repeat protein (TIGR01451 family)